MDKVARNVITIAKPLHRLLKIKASRESVLIKELADRLLRLGLKVDSTPKKNGSASE